MLQGRRKAMVLDAQSRHTMKERNDNDYPRQGASRMEEIGDGGTSAQIEKVDVDHKDAMDQAGCSLTGKELTSESGPGGAGDVDGIDMNTDEEEDPILSVVRTGNDQDEVDSPMDQSEPSVKSISPVVAEHAVAEPTVRELIPSSQPVGTTSLPQATTSIQERQGDRNVSMGSSPIPPSNVHLGQDVSSRPIILSLPIDSLHCIASFLSPGEWTRFGQSGKGAGRVCREVFRRVRMHGFRCATEVVTAWKLGQHGDARELAALYIDSGVPIYPHSLGHSYHTLNWRMGVEATEASRTDTRAADGNDAVDEHDNSAESNSRRSSVDRFYSERYEARARESYSEGLTYLEEKCLYWLDKDAEEGDANSPSNLRRQLSMTPNRMAARPLPGFRHVGQNEGGLDGGIVDPPQRLPARLHSSIFSSTQPTSPSMSSGLHRSNSQADLRLHAPKVLVRLHRHLLDQHLLGRPSVDDGDGVMKTPSVSLSADFFHPHFTLRPLSDRQHLPSSATTVSLAAGDGFVSGDLVSIWNNEQDGSRLHENASPNGHENGESNGQGPVDVEPSIVQPTPIAEPTAREAAGADDSDSEHETDRIHSDNLPNAPAAFELPVNPLVPGPAPRPLVAAPVALPPTSPSSAYPHLVLSNVDLEVYSATSSTPNVSVEGFNRREVKLHLQTRFEAYHKRLETLLSQNDSVSFEECILDFWDEFLPQTANIHYYDRNTAVPRISRLHKFLTKPCPKAIGIVQCEIERIKLHSKKKGVNMKGRFFPTYEYRLFIRHRAPEATEGDSPEPSRQDTVVMIAKNRGRKHLEPFGSFHLAPGNKKGANNYFLYMPQQEDVDDHFNSVNEEGTAAASVQNGAAPGSIASGDESVLLGRLQSNFIGTEFQIFSPRSNKPPAGRSFGRTSACQSSGMSSDDDFDYDSGACSDVVPSSRRRSRSRGRFSRLSLRRSSLSSPGEETPTDEGELLDAVNPASRTIRRTRSSSDVPYSRPTRTSRRAISNAADAAELLRRQQALQEEEDGAITYTANLLGSRPRIMDVCIPKISAQGPAGSEWKKYLDSCDDSDGVSPNRMLNRFKQLQQRMENEEQGNTTNNAEERSPVVAAGDEYSPPGDFGLLVLQNRPPWWNIELGSFVLNFGGRVSVASVKNFQLCDPNDQDYIMLQFGRIQGRHSFTMDFQHPLTAVQAFAIAISSLQSKISFG